MILKATERSVRRAERRGPATTLTEIAAALTGTVTALVALASALVGPAPSGPALVCDAAHSEKLRVTGDGERATRSGDPEADPSREDGDREPSEGEP